jgi:hypothetical protein
MVAIKLVAATTAILLSLASAASTVDYTPPTPSPSPAPQCVAERKTCTTDGYVIKCCDGLSCNPSSSYDAKGKICSKTYVAPTPTPTYATPAPPKCRPEGERCAGDQGFPAVPWIKCCDGLTCDGPDTSYKGYGKVCSKGYVAPTPTPTPTYATDAPPPTCVKSGGDCDVYGKKCCNKLKCTKGYGDKYTCKMPGPTASPTTTTTKKTTTTTSKCLAVSNKCNGTNLKCCPGSECQKNSYGYDSSCVKVYK